MKVHVEFRLGRLWELQATDVDVDRDSLSPDRQTEWSVSLSQIYCKLTVVFAELKEQGIDKRTAV